MALPPGYAAEYGAKVKRRVRDQRRALAPRQRAREYLLDWATVAWVACGRPRRWRHTFELRYLSSDGAWWILRRIA